MQIKFSISNLLILISSFVTLLSYFYPSLYILGINNIFLNEWLYHILIIQFFIWTFIHWWLMHLIFNSVFLYVFWNIVEILIWRNKYILFFVFTVLFNWILLSVFSSANTVWISWFAMALLWYYVLDLRLKHNPEYKGWITAIILNIWIWFMPWISLFWHLFWVISGILFFILNKFIFDKIQKIKN